MKHIYFYLLITDYMTTADQTPDLPLFVKPRKFTAP